MRFFMSCFKIEQQHLIKISKNILNKHDSIVKILQKIFIVYKSHCLCVCVLYKFDNFDQFALNAAYIWLSIRNKIQISLHISKIYIYIQIYFF